MKCQVMDGAGLTGRRLREMIARRWEEARDMAIVLHLDELMAERGVKLVDLAEEINLSNANLSHIKTGKIRAIRFSTLDALCEALGCQPGDILKHVSREE